MACTCEHRAFSDTTMSSKTLTCDATAACAARATRVPLPPPSGLLNAGPDIPASSCSVIACWQVHNHRLIRQFERALSAYLHQLRSLHHGHKCGAIRVRLRRGRRRRSTGAAAKLR